MAAAVRRNRHHSHPLFVVLDMDKSTAKRPWFISDRSPRPPAKAILTESLWEARKWGDKQDAERSSEFMKVRGLPHKVEISLTLGIEE